MERIRINDRNVPRENTPAQQNRNPTLGETIHKSDEEIKEAQIKKLGLHFKKIMQRKVEG